MDEVTILKSLSDQVRETRNILKVLMAEMESSESDAQIKRSNILGEKCKKGAMLLAKESELLSRSVPELLPGDEGVQYFLTIAELQQSIEDLRDLKQIGERILNDNLEYSQAIQQIIKDRDSLNAKYKALVEKSSLNNAEGDASSADQTSKREEERIRELEAKIRDTKLVYKILKSQFGVFLETIDPDGSKNYGQFLQALWNAHIEGIKGESDFVKISHLDFDVDQEQINELVENSLILVSPDDPDQVKLSNFVEK